MFNTYVPQFKNSLSYSDSATGFQYSFCDLVKPHKVKKNNLGIRIVKNVRPTISKACPPLLDKIASCLLIDRPIHIWKVLRNPLANKKGSQEISAWWIKKIINCQSAIGQCFFASFDPHPKEFTEYFPQVIKQEVGALWTGKHDTWRNPVSRTRAYVNITHEAIQIGLMAA